jgi:ubiquinone/menaquinone biosynthesis C-methylase UbiE
VEPMRKPFQGVANIIRFNWHFYVFSAVGLLVVIFVSGFFGGSIRTGSLIFSALVFAPILISLIVSYYVYDLSNLYSLDWLGDLRFETGSKIVNINAGFDETSESLKAKFPETELVVLDFYDPAKHTEISIKRARKAYPPFPNTGQITTAKLPLRDNSADAIFVILSAHEIRNGEERSLFFNELSRTLKPDGQIVVVEHLRDLPNFLAYNIGSLHFHSRKSWFETFKSANLKIESELKITPFISTFILKKHGTSS